jgi:hypothetical protein
MLAGCSQIKLAGSKNAEAGSEANDSPPAGPGQNGHPATVAGAWRLGYQYQGQTFNASVKFKQHGASFDGTGKEDESGADFLIDKGKVRGDQITFEKKYAGNKASQPPVEYAGTVTTSHEGDYDGPYLRGEYSTRKKDGSAATGNWDAVLDLAADSSKVAAASKAAESSKTAATQAPETQQAEAAPEQKPAEQAPAPENASPRSPSKAPDLSGKWDVAFEYNFNTVKSVMFLEQDHDRITGHGVDDTKEKFVIDIGQYHFPNIMFVRKYPKMVAKGKKTKEVGKARELTFKGQVSIANDKDYQGPYMSGKTDGGGSWEGELHK